MGASVLQWVLPALRTRRVLGLEGLRIPVLVLSWLLDESAGQCHTFGHFSEEVCLRPAGFEQW